jgi:hypothetical protein
VTSLEAVRAAREAADAADRALRHACLDALKDYPLRQVAIAAGKNRQTIYNWVEATKRG